MEEGTRLDEFSSGRNSHQGGHDYGRELLAAFGKLIFVNGDAGGFVCGHDCVYAPRPGSNFKVE